MLLLSFNFFCVVLFRGYPSSQTKKSLFKRWILFVCSSLRAPHSPYLTTEHFWDHLHHHISSLYWLALSIFITIYFKLRMTVTRTDRDTCISHPVCTLEDVSWLTCREWDLSSILLTSLLPVFHLRLSVNMTVPQISQPPHPPPTIHLTTRLNHVTSKAAFYFTYLLAYLLWCSERKGFWDQWNTPRWVCLHTFTKKQKNVNSEINK